MAKIIPFPGNDSHRDLVQPEFSQDVPHDETGILDLTSDQLEGLLYTEPAQAEDMVTIEPRLKSEDVDAIPILKRVLALLRSIEQSGDVKATAKGFLPTSLVKELFSGAYADSEPPFISVIREGDGPTLLFERRLAQKSGLIRFANQRFTITKAASAALKNNDYTEIYKRLLTTFLKKPHILEERDRIDVGDATAATYFLLLHACRFASDNLLYGEDLSFLIWQLFPQTDEEHRFGFHPAFELLDHAICLRFFARFGEPFGLFKTVTSPQAPIKVVLPDRQGMPWPPKPRHYGPWKRTNVFDRVFRWKIEAPKEPILTAEEASQFWIELSFGVENYRAERCAVLAIERDPTNPDAYAEWAMTHDDSPEQALEIVRTGLSRHGEAEHLSSQWPPDIQRHRRARLRIIQADLLSDLGRINEAITEYMSVLEDDPVDRHGVRYLLVPILIGAGRLDDAETLLDRSNEAGTFALWDRTLIAYARNGAHHAYPFLETALEANQFVPKALTDRRWSYREIPDRYAPGTPDEAIIYADGAGKAWTAVKGAKQWLRSR